MKRIICILLSTLMLTAVFTGCKDGEDSSSKAASNTASTSSETEPQFDKADRVVTDDSDIFKGGKMLGGTVVDYVAKEVWGGQENWDCLGQLRDNGMNWVRVGVLMKENEELAKTPFDQWGTIGQQGWSTLEYAEYILRDAEKNGLRKNLFFFLSPEAASGAEQPAPAEWKNLTPDQTAAKLKEYCYETTKYFVDKGIEIDLYDMGNEIEGGILDFRPDIRIKRPEGLNIQVEREWMRENVWKIEAKLLTAAIEGVKKADPDAKINLHASCFGLGVDNYYQRGFYEAMVDFGVPFDVIGVSYYWDIIHQGDVGLGQSQEAYYKTKECLDAIDYYVNTLKKKFIFSEYVYQYEEPSDEMKVGPDVGYPLTPEGQRDWIRDFLKFVMETPEVSGCIYFYPEYYPNFSRDARFQSLNAAGLFTEALKPNLALKEFNKYKKPQ